MKLLKKLAEKTTSTMELYHIKFSSNADSDLNGNSGRLMDLATK